MGSRYLCHFVVGFVVFKHLRSETIWVRLELFWEKVVLVECIRFGINELSILLFISFAGKFWVLDIRIGVVCFLRFLVDFRVCMTNYGTEDGRRVNLE